MVGAVTSWARMADGWWTAEDLEEVPASRLQAALACELARAMDREVRGFLRTASGTMTADGWRLADGWGVPKDGAGDGARLH